jgi:hypothetical protein
LQHFAYNEANQQLAPIDPKFGESRRGTKGLMTVNQTTSSPDQKTTSTVADFDQLFEDLTTLSEQAKDRESFYENLLNRAAKFSNSPSAVFWLQAPGKKLLEMTAVGVLPTARTYSGADPRFSGVRQTAQSVYLEADGRDHPPAIVSPVTVLNESIGLLAFYRLPDESSEVARAYLPLMDAISEIASEFEKNQKLLERKRDGDKYKAIATLSLNAHRHLDCRKTAVHLVNDSRAYVGCDRVGLFVGSAGHSRLVACSGVTDASSRSSYAKLLRPVVKRLMKTRETIVFREDPNNQSRQFQRYLDSFPADQQPKSIVLVPLSSVNAVRPLARQAIPIGAMIFESFEHKEIAELCQSIAEMTDHASSAMDNALRFERIPLRWFWNALHWFASQFGAPYRIRTAIWSLLIVALVYFLVAFQTEFKVEVQGELRPVQERNVFAPADGVISEILVQHGDRVREDQVIITLRSPDLELELKQLDGEIETARQKLEGLLTIMKTADSNDPDNARVQTRLAADVIDIQSTISGLVSRKDVVIREIEELVVKSPIAGDVVTWQVTERLDGRPVHRGESLLKVAEVDGDWEVVMDIPDKKFGYITDAQKSIGRSDLVVSLGLVSNPDKKISTHLDSISIESMVRDSGEASVRMTAPLPTVELSEFKPGTSVVGRIHCGRHSVAYVWTAELMNTVKRKFFW